MSVELEKCSRIISEVLAYCNYFGGADFEMSLKHGTDGWTRMTVRCTAEELPEEALKNLDRSLNVHRQREVEQSYWELSGESEMASEITLAGIMVDRATVAYDGSTLDILMLRQNKWD